MPDPGPVVADTGPLIVLAAIGALELLPRLYGSIFVPDSVFLEVSRGGPDRPGCSEVCSATWISRQRVDPPPEAFLLKDLGPGEAEAIALAARTQARLLLIDDLRGRRVAAMLYGLQVKGAPGILVAAKRAGYIAAVRPLLDEMVKQRYFLAPDVIRRTLREVGEE